MMDLTLSFGVRSAMAGKGNCWDSGNAKQAHTMKSTSPGFSPMPSVKIGLMSCPPLTQFAFFSSLILYRMNAGIKDPRTQG